MKKLSALILIIVLVFSLSAIGASAYYVEGYTAHPGDIITIDVSLPEGYGNIKSAAIEFSYSDDAFEYVSSKWTMNGLMIKSFDPEAKKGVAASSSAKEWNGCIFQLQLKLKDDAELCPHPIDVTVMLQNTNNEKRSIELTYDVLAKEYVEVDDETTPADFAAAVDVINPDNHSEETYHEIETAYELYLKLTAGEKEDAAESYKALIDKIQAYNEFSENANIEAQNAVSIAFSAISRVFEYLSKFFEALCLTIWN